MNKKYQEYLNEQLLEAFSKGASYEVKVLIQSGADLNSFDINTLVYSYTYKCELPLISIACEHGKLELVELLLSKGADINAVPSKKYNIKNWISPLVVACLSGHEKIVQFLLENNANPFCGNPLEKLQNKLSLEQSKGSENAKKYENILKILQPYVIKKQQNKNNQDELEK